MSLAARRSDRSTRAALRRVLTAQLRRGLDEATRADAAPLVHDLRKRIKELRGLVRLLRPGLPGAKRMDRRLRDAARGLSGQRDLEVMVSQFDALTGRLRDPGRFAGLRMQIFDEHARRCATDDSNTLENYVSCFRGLERDLSRLRLERKASALLWSGIFSTYASAQALHAEALESFHGAFDAPPFHDLRKRVKQHWYQARLLAAIRPGRMQAHIARIDALGEALGDHNDLDVLMAFLDSREGLSGEDRAAREMFRGHLMARRRDLAARALSLADRALAQKPEKLVATWRGWWRKWRKRARR